MVVVVDRVVVKKVIHVFLKKYNLVRLPVQLETDKAKKSCGLGFVLSSLMSSHPPQEFWCVRWQWTMCLFWENVLQVCQKWLKWFIFPIWDALVKPCSDEMVVMSRRSIPNCFFHFATIFTCWIVFVSKNFHIVVIYSVNSIFFVVVHTFGDSLCHLLTWIITKNPCFSYSDRLTK